MKNILTIITLALFVSMIAASASEIEITSPVATEKHYIWDEVPITFTTQLGDEYNYTTFVNGVPEDVFAPESGGKYLIKVVGENPDCEECSYYAEQTIDIGFFPRTEETRIKIISPALGTNYYVGDNVAIEFESPLTERSDFIFNTYVTGPDKVSRQTETWAPDMPGKYGIKVEAIGITSGLSFASSRGYEAQSPE